MHTAHPNHEPALFQIHSGRTIPGQFAGQMGWQYDPWFIEASRFKDTQYIHGAFPEYGFQRWEGPTNPPNYVFEAPRLELPREVLQSRFAGRLSLLQSLDEQRQQLDLLHQLNERHARRRAQDAQLEARIQSFELAYRMQMDATDAFARDCAA